jgi:hypothetical protein
MTRDGRIRNESRLINDNRCFASRFPPLLLLKSEILLFEKKIKELERAARQGSNNRNLKMTKDERRLNDSRLRNDSSRLGSASLYSLSLKIKSSLNHSFKGG